MYGHLNENMFPANPCFHLPRKDGLYQPIAFAFVTETMYRDIINERLNLLAALSSAFGAQGTADAAPAAWDSGHPQYDKARSKSGL